MEVRTTDPPRVSAMQEFEALPEGTRAELIDGEIVMMASPTTTHQLVGVELVTQLRAYLRGKTCRVYYETDVQLYAKHKSDVFRPDVIVVCNRLKDNGKRIVGAPDLIIEIISPSTASRDSILKLKRYRDAGVREYWIVDPDRQTVAALTLDNQRYMYECYGPADRAPVAVLEGCEIDLSLVFPAAQD